MKTFLKKSADAAGVCRMQMERMEWMMAVAECKGDRIEYDSDTSTVIFRKDAEAAGQGRL
jgi:hypothetical protein